MNKKNRNKYKINNKNKTIENGSNTYVLLVYVILPIVVTCGVYYVLYNYLIKYTSSVNIGDFSIINSKYTIEKIFTPFISCVLLIISLLVSVVAIKFIKHIWKKQISVIFGKKIIFYGSILVLLLSAITFFYSRADSFEYWNYGIENTNTEMNYLPLIQIPSIRGGNITSEAAPPLYRVIHFLANLLKTIVDEFDLLITMSGAILIPLKIEVNKYDLKE